jgi:hypothetical protein
LSCRADFANVRTDSLFVLWQLHLTTRAAYSAVFAETKSSIDRNALRGNVRSARAR